MRNGSVEIVNNKIIIHGKKVPKGILIFLGFFVLAAVVIPILATVLLVQSKEGLSIGIFITYFICGLIGFYMLRLLLWNAYGKEILVITPEKITYCADFKFFLGNSKEFPINETSKKDLALRINIMGETDENTEKSNVFNEEDPINESEFSEENETIETVLTISKEDMKLVQQVIDEVIG